MLFVLAKSEISEEILIYTMKTNEELLVKVLFLRLSDRDYLTNSSLLIKY